MTDRIESRYDIAIVLIGLNVERFLPDCLASIRRADWPQDRLEKIYVDSGSTDRSVRIVQAEPDWRVLVLSDPLPSPAKGRNLGMLNASCGLVQLLDADMLLDPAWLTVAVESMHADPQAAAVFGRTVERYPRRNLYHAMRNAIWAMHPVGPSNRLPGASLVRLGVVRECGLQNAQLGRWEDTEMALRLLAKGYKLLGRPEIMCLHDSDMRSFRQYWHSNFRGGQGNYDILRHTTGKGRWYFLRELRRSALWPAVLVGAALCSLLMTSAVPLLLGLIGFAVALVREIRRGWRTGGSFNCGLAWAAHWTLSKLPYTCGFVQACLWPKRERHRQWPSGTSSSAGDQAAC